MKHVYTWRRIGGVAAALLALAGCKFSARDAFSGDSAGTGGSGGWGGGTGGGGGASLVPLLHAEAVAVGASHSCAILEDGRIACWGDGSRGQLGDGNSGKGWQRAAPGVIDGIEDAVAIRAGGDTTCAILGDGGVRCWGDGAFGQLGDGHAEDGYLSAVPVVVKDLAGVVDLAADGANACAVLSDGSVRCWGRNAADAWLGFESADCGPYALNPGDPTPTGVPCEATPREVPGLHDAVAVESGGGHNCVITKGGTARCWGADHFGQLGDGNSGPDAFHAAPVEVGNLADVQRLALGTSHTCAAAGPAATVLCWGDNAAGQLGIGTNALDSYKITPTDVTSLKSVVDLDAAGRTTCAVLADSTVSCWGDTATVLPVSPEKGGSALVPTPVPGVAGAVAVRTGGAHVCALMADATVTCWGLGDHGQLGTGVIGLAEFSMEPVIDAQ